MFMDAIEEIEDLKRLPGIAEARVDPIEAKSIDLDLVSDRSRIQKMLYKAELEELQGIDEPNTSDDDRAAGRMEYVRLDLMSE
jgi:hypothetical protein